MSSFCNNELRKTICTDVIVTDRFDLRNFCKYIDYIEDYCVRVKEVHYKVIKYCGSYKLLAEGVLCIKVKYCSCCCDGRILCQEFYTNFVKLIDIPACSEILNAYVCINHCKVCGYNKKDLLVSVILEIKVLLKIRDCMPIICNNIDYGVCSCNNRECHDQCDINFKNDCYPCC